MLRIHLKPSKVNIVKETLMQGQGCLLLQADVPELSSYLGQGRTIIWR